MPVLALRGWLTGMRPVVGALGASGLMLLACSWFVFNPGAVDVGRDADMPSAVRINGGVNEAVGESHALRPSAATTSTSRIGTGTTRARHARVTPPERTSAVDGRGPGSDPSSAPRPQAGAASAPTQPSAPSAAPTTSTPDDSGGVTVTTPTLPPPLDGAPTVTTPTVPVPQLPSVPPPDLPTTPPKLGLP